MRRLVIILLLSASMAAVSAGSNQIGISFTPEWMWSEGNQSMDLLITLDGGNYFGGGSGIEYGLGMNVPLRLNDSQLPLDPSSFTMPFRLGYGFRTGSWIGFAFGIGLYGIYAGSATSPGITAGAYGKIAVDFTIINAIRLTFGAAIGGQIIECLFPQGSAGEVSFRSAFFAAPFASISYAY